MWLATLASVVGNTHTETDHQLVMRVSPLQMSGRVRLTGSMRFDRFLDTCIRGIQTPNVRAYFKTTFR